MTEETKIVKTDDEWSCSLTDSQYKVTRCGATEQAFTGPWWDEHRAGQYDCICCGTPLFRSETKYDSGTGWPSFFSPIKPELVDEKEDTAYGMRRIEIVCAKCDAHLGHVFPDGPRPTGLRYCMNGTSLNFIPDKA